MYNSGGFLFTLAELAKLFFVNDSLFIRLMSIELESPKTDKLIYIFVSESGKKWENCGNVGLWKK